MHAKGCMGHVEGDDAGIVSKLAEGLAKMMTVIVTVFEAAGLAVSEKKTETTLLRPPDRTTLAPPLAIEHQDKYINRRPSSYT